MRSLGDSGTHPQSDTSHTTPTVPLHDRLLALPLLASTHFCMEVLLRGAVLDLRSASEVLTFDPCALLRLYALAAEEFPSYEDRPRHLDECIIAIGKSGLARALYGAPSTWEQQARLSAFAEHGVHIARCAQIAAATLGLCEETAYVVGLLHAIGTLPAEIGWMPTPLSRQQAIETTALIARLYQLPPLLGQALRKVAEGNESSVWTALIEAAHQLADSPVTSLAQDAPRA